MYPTKSMFDYMSEMNRLFPRSNENEIFHSPPTPNTSLQSFNQSMGPSSSSTDTSPESFPDLTQLGFTAEHIQHHYARQQKQGSQYENHGHQYERQQKQDSQYDNHGHQYESHVKPTRDVPFLSPQMNDTPFLVRRHRPIVGRKVMPATESHLSKLDDASKVWLEESLSRTPPSSSTDQKYNQNAFYELFPPENKGTEFKTPIKTPPSSFTTSPNMSNMSPRMTSPSYTNMSPRMTNASPTMTNAYQRMAKMSPRMTEMSLRMPEMLPSRKTSPGSSCSSFSPRFKDPIVGPSTSFQPNMGPSKMCTFCRKNGETPLVYMTHTVKEKVGNKNIATCPILRSHVCATCGASGDNAHTITYCPVLRSTNNGQPLQSTTITLKNTRVKSNGRRRY